jgi:hypothetical protein
MGESAPFDGAGEGPYSARRARDQGILILLLFLSVSLLSLSERRWMARFSRWLRVENRASRMRVGIANAIE